MQQNAEASGFSDLEPSDSERRRQLCKTSKSTRNTYSDSRNEKGVESAVIMGGRVERPGWIRLEVRAARRDG